MSASGRSLDVGSRIYVWERKIIHHVRGHPNVGSGGRTMFWASFLYGRARHKIDERLWLIYYAEKNALKFIMIGVRLTIFFFYSRLDARFYLSFPSAVAGPIIKIMNDRRAFLNCLMRAIIQVFREDMQLLACARKCLEFLMKIERSIISQLRAWKFKNIQASKIRITKGQCNFVFLITTLSFKSFFNLKVRYEKLIILKKCLKKIIPSILLSTKEILTPNWSQTKFTSKNLQAKTKIITFSLTLYINT